MSETKTQFLSLNDLDVNEKRVLVRTDLNVPLENGVVTDTNRIEKSVPTIKTLVEKNAKVIVTSHLGRPKGKVVPEYSLKPVVEQLSKFLGLPVEFAEDCVGEKAEAIVNGMAPGSVVLLENLRYHVGEEKNHEDFAANLAKLADLYVNDAFASSHRAHASVVGVAKLLPAAAGHLMESELNALGNALEVPQRPVLAVASGAKVSTKLSVLKNLVQKVDRIVLGGGMANTVVYAQGKEIGNSLCEKDMVDTVKELMVEAEKFNCELIVPVDGIAAAEFADNAPSQVVDMDNVPSDQMVLDIGPKTVEHIKARLQDVKTVIWNGPLGAFEKAGFETGTRDVAKEVAKLTGEGKLLSVAGGGDTVAALSLLDDGEGFSYVSTAGGAFLEWMEGRTLPGVAALQEAYNR